MVLLADYDPISGLIDAFVDTDDPTHGYQPTGAPLPLGTVTQRLSVETAYPDPYVAAFPELLGPGVVRFDADRQMLIRTYPDADYSPPTLRRSITWRLDDVAKSLLGFTDWVIIRQNETGQPAPPNIAAYRSAVRAWHHARVSDAESATPAQLLTFGVAAPAELQAAPRSGSVTPAPTETATASPSPAAPVPDGAAAPPTSSETPTTVTRRPVATEAPAVEEASLSEVPADATPAGETPTSAAPPADAEQVDETPPAGGASAPEVAQ